jgi:hypothetical protein
MREETVGCWDYVEEAARTTGYMQIKLRIGMGSICVMLKGKLVKLVEGCFGRDTKTLLAKRE